MFKKLAIVLGIFIGIVVLAITSLWIYDLFTRAERIASILNIDSPPESINSIRCESYFTSDVITECTFDIDPNEFSLLLTGYEFQKKQRSTNSLILTQMIKEDFQVEYEYFATPVEFEYGGYVKLYTNAEYSKAIIDLYIE